MLKNKLMQYTVYTLILQSGISIQQSTSSGSEMSTFVCEGALIAMTVCSSNSVMLRTSLLVTYAYVQT